MSFFSINVKSIFFLLAVLLVILGNMLAPGYLLTLDMVWGDTINWVWSGDNFNNTTPVYLLLSGLNIMLPSWVVQKILLGSIFFLLLYLPYRLLPYLTSNLSRLFAGLLFTLNPFVYSRLLAGQWEVLLGYACLPVIFYALTRLTQKRDARSGLMLGGSLIVVGACSIHFLYVSLLISMLWIGCHVAKSLFNGDHSPAWTLIKSSLMGILFFLCTSTYWIIPALLRDTPIENRFDSSHFEEFAVSENHLISAPLNLAVLGGFWAEGDEWRYYFIWPQSQIIFWVAAFFILCLVIFGFRTLLVKKETRFVAIFLLVLGVLSYILALGAWGGAFSSFNVWMYENFPGWSGLRDSHKIAGVLALVYVLFASVGFDKLVTKSKEGSTVTLTLIPLIFVLPFIFGMYELFGFRGQLVPTDYPTSWYETKAILDSSPTTEKMLVLPWQGYFSLPFANQLVVANPTEVFFGRDQTLFGRSVGLENIYDQEVDPTYRAWDTFMHEAQFLPTETIVDTLRQYNITYLFIIVNPMAEDQNLWLMPGKTISEFSTSTTLITDPKQSNVVKALLQAPHEIIIDSEVILYRFTY